MGLKEFGSGCVGINLATKWAGLAWVGSAASDEYPVAVDFADDGLYDYYGLKVQSSSLLNRTLI